MQANASALNAYPEIANLSLIFSQKQTITNAQFFAGKQNLNNISVSPITQKGDSVNFVKKRTFVLIFFASITPATPKIKISNGEQYANQEVLADTSAAGFSAGTQPGRMPEIGRSLAHDAGVDLIAQWINRLPSAACSAPQ